MSPDVTPLGADDINDVMPHLTKMLRAMHRRDKEAAIKSGEAALALLPEGSELNSHPK